jgi:hypothetical protein
LTRSLCSAYKRYEPHPFHGNSKIYQGWSVGVWPVQ